MSTDTFSGQVVDLEIKVQELKEHLELIAAVVASLQPVHQLLVKYGVSGEQRRAVWGIINDMSERIDGGKVVSFAEFEERVTSVVAQPQCDRLFLRRLVEALKVERPDSKRLFDQLTTGLTLFR